MPHCLDVPLSDLISRCLYNCTAEELFLGGFDPCCNEICVHTLRGREGFSIAALRLLATCCAWVRTACCSSGDSQACSLSSCPARPCRQAMISSIAVRSSGLSCCLADKHSSPANSGPAGYHTMSCKRLYPSNQQSYLNNVSHAWPCVKKRETTCALAGLCGRHLHRKCTRTVSQAGVAPSC